MNIVFAGHDFKFARPIIAAFEQADAWNVRLDDYQGHKIQDVARSTALLASADAVFCEWGLGNLEWYSQNKRSEQALVVRIHSQELGLDFLRRTAWDNVDAVIVICEHKRRTLLEVVPSIASKVVFIYNAVDAEELYRPKRDDSIFDVGMLGMAPRIKDPMLALDIIQRVRETDPRFRLRIKGHAPASYQWLWRRDEERAYYEAFNARVADDPDVVVFDDHGDDVAEWFQHCAFIISTSEQEGSHQAIAEGMASGAVPLVRNWDGAAELYGMEHIFCEAEQAAERIVRLAADRVAFAALSDQVATRARELFDVDVVVPSIVQVVERVVRQKQIQHVGG